MNQRAAAPASWPKYKVEWLNPDGSVKSAPGEKPKPKKPRPPNPLRKSHRNARMVELKDGGWTLQRIGDEYGLTRERVRQIIAKERKRSGTQERNTA